MLSTLGGTLKKAFGARGSKGGRVKKLPPPLPLAPPPERKVRCVSFCFIFVLFCFRVFDVSGGLGLCAHG